MNVMRDNLDKSNIAAQKKDNTSFTEENKNLSWKNLQKQEVTPQYYEA